MTNATLCLHSDVDAKGDVTLIDLRKVPTPSPTRTWFPVGHADVVDTVTSRLHDAGFAISRQQFGLTRNNSRLFASLDLTTELADGVTLAIGIRNSLDKSFPLSFCGGSRVFVCDNLAFCGDIYVSKKHTKYGRQHFEQGVIDAVAGLEQFRIAETKWIGLAQEKHLTDQQADSILLRSFENHAIDRRLLAPVIQQWREPELEEYRPRTAWSLLNCFTHVLGRDEKKTLEKQARQTLRLRGLIDKAIAV